MVVSGTLEAEVVGFVGKPWHFQGVILGTHTHILVNGKHVRFLEKLVLCFVLGLMVDVAYKPGGYGKKRSFLDLWQGTSRYTFWITRYNL